MELRKEKRAAGTRDITIKDGDRTYPAVIVDISREGLSIKSECALPTYKMIEIIMVIADQPVHLKGSVRWVNENPKKKNLYEIGIKLKNPPQKYLDYIMMEMPH